MHRIYKYPLSVTLMGVHPPQTLNLPMGARPLSVQDQNGTLTLWALVPVGPVAEQRITVHIVGTGEEASRVVGRGVAYVGTAQMQNSGLVWHVFFEAEV